MKLTQYRKRKGSKGEKAFPISKRNQMKYKLGDIIDFKDINEFGETYWMYGWKIAKITDGYATLKKDGSITFLTLNQSEDIKHTSPTQMPQPTPKHSTKNYERVIDESDKIYIALQKTLKKAQAEGDEIKVLRARRSISDYLRGRPIGTLNKYYRELERGKQNTASTKAMTENSATKILHSYKNTRGYDLAIKTDEYGNIYLYDGIVREEITNDSQKELRKRIRDWIANE